MDLANNREKQDRVHGFIYQLKLLMLFLSRGVQFGYSFRLGTEIKEAKKFDDLVFEYKGTDGKKKNILLQAKHRKRDDLKISADELLTTTNGNYSLVKYFFSYQDSKKEKLFKDSEIEKIVLCTNIDFDSDSLKDKGIGYKKIKKEIDILTHKDVDEKAAQYEFEKDVGSLLKPKLQNYHLTKLANTLAMKIFKSPDIRHHQGIFKDYHIALAKEVIDVRNKKFHEHFLKSEGISDCAAKFRNAFEKGIEQQSEGKVTLTNINAMIDNNEISDIKIRFNLSKKFGSGKFEGWPDVVVSDNDIEEYLDRLVFAVNQPNEEKVGQIVRNEIGKGLDNTTTNNMYHNMYVTMMNWMQGKGENTFLSSDYGAKLLEVAKPGVSIRFNVSNPVNSFTGRIEKLEELHKELYGGDTATSRIAVISGLGGIGKSELARKYANQYSSYYDDNVIWINAGSHQSLEESFRKLARVKLNISTKDANGGEKETVYIVQEVYRSLSKEKSLFIFDNAVQCENITKRNESIHQFLPSLPSGYRSPHILITSRNQTWEGLRVLPLNVFTKDQAVEFVEKTLLIENNEQAAIDLAKKLQYFPLALHQAVAYIKVTDRKLKNVCKEFKIRDYLERYETKTKELLDFPFPVNSDISYEKTTYTTWDITIESIRQQEHGKKASEILDIAAYFMPDRISSRIFVNLEDTDDEGLGFIIEMLKEYSMVKSEEDEWILSIHRLVQHVTRLKHKASGEEIKCIRMALKLFEDPENNRNVDVVERPKIRFENLLEDTDSVDQARSVMNYASEHGELVGDFVNLTVRIVKRLHCMLRYEEAELFRERTLGILKRELGPDHVDTLEAMTKTAIMF